MYYFVERSVAIVKPKQAFLDWLSQTFDYTTHLTVESLRTDCNAYLIPEIYEVEQGIGVIENKYQNLFAMELSTWTEDENLWPQLTRELFWEWFDVEIYPTTIDIYDDSTDKNEKKSKIENTIH